jgi:membrane protein required for colicin V production
MGFNWLDILLLVIIAITVIIGAIRGFIRQIIGLVAVILGLILAIKYYSYGSKIFAFIHNDVLAQLLGFFLIFLAVLCLGLTINILLAKAVKGPFKALNRLLGAGFGLIKGVLICCVVVFGFLIFPVNAKALEESQLTPYCIEIAKAAYSLIPQELKDKFNEAYQEIMGKRGKDVKKA